MRSGPRFFYLHGFASGPGSKKGVALAAHYALQGVDLQRLNLRVPSLAQLRFSTMLQVVREAISDPLDRAERAVLFGSSLGGLVAAHVAAAEARVAALVLLAPAFDLVPRWRARLGEAGWRSWQQSGWLPTLDHTTGEQAQVDFGFIADLQEHCSPDFPDVRVPTLIIHGRGDDVVDIAASRRFTADRRQVRLVEVDDGHELTHSLATIAAEADAFLRPFLGVPEGRSAADENRYRGHALPVARPALDPSSLSPYISSGYPEPFASRVLPRERRALGDALGLTRIGVNLTTLPPNKESAMRHWHTHEDELIFVIEGEVVLRTEEGEQTLTAGMCAGFPAGVQSGHQLINRSSRDARYLEISNRDASDVAEYPAVDLAYLPGGKAVFVHKDGTAY